MKAVLGILAILTALAIPTAFWGGVLYIAYLAVTRTY